VQARQNALLGLNVAIGQLQRHAGADQRATATATVTDPSAANPWFTGVWDTSSSGEATPLAWLVSGNELVPRQTTPARALNREAPAPDVALTLDPAGLATNHPAAEVPNRVRLVGGGSAAVAGTGREHGAVVVPGVPIYGVTAGSATTRTLGRFAYWAGDQGVKAALVDPLAADALTYTPYDTAQARARVMQRVALDSGPAEYEPRATTNAARVRNVLSLEQVPLLEFLRDEAGNDVNSTELTRARFHEWAVGNFGVLANTGDTTNAARRGLRRDLSQVPETLGTAYAAYADFTTHMETPGTTTAGAPEAVPVIGAESVRRRHRITPPMSDQGWQHGIRPVLASFILQFNIRSQGGTVGPELEVRSRYLMGLWNPYTSALVPEPLVLEIEGLPTLTASAATSAGAPLGSVNVPLQSLLGGGGPMRINLPVDESNPALVGDPDDRSWLPGRKYYWRTRGGTVGNWDSEFYNRSLNVPNALVWTVPAGSIPSAVVGTTQLTINGIAATLRLTLRRASDDAVLAIYTSPTFDPFTVPPRPLNSNNEWRITFPFRLAESFDTIALDPSLWLTTPGRDPRERDLGLGVYLPFGTGGTDPASPDYVGSPPISAPDRLLDRVMGNTGKSFNEDVPVFELPRQPFLSVGELQHLARNGERPFAVGNPWGDAETRKLFDRFFYSGLVVPATGETLDEPDLAARQPLPNPTQRALAIKPNGTSITSADLGDPAAPGLSARYVVQGGAFNINSTSAAAWRAVLRGVRFPADRPFIYADSAATQGAPLDDTATSTHVAPEAAFLRFPQTAQETFKASDPRETVTYAASNVLPDTPPNVPSLANTHLFRRGVRTVNATALDALAAALAEGVELHGASVGPFRSLAEFLGPLTASPFDGRSVIERAIAEAGLNADIDEFSSQFLTQADVFAALAPRMFVRSDTFVVRSFGEVINPTTGETEAKAWCEAVVQRLPVPVSAANLTAPTVTEYIDPPGAFGRRFEVVAFRWLAEDEL
jgi:hypothetical protein